MNVYYIFGGFLLAAFILLLVALALGQDFNALCGGTEGSPNGAGWWLAPDSPALAKNWTPESGLEKPPWLDINGNPIEYIGACPEVPGQPPTPPTPPVFSVKLAKPCTRTGATQTCEYMLSWTATGETYQLQQRLPPDATWYDIYPRLTALSQLDQIFGDPGSRQICWRTWAYIGATASLNASNAVCRTTPAIVAVPVPAPPSAMVIQ